VKGDHDEIIAPTAQADFKGKGCGDTWDKNMACSLLRKKF